MASRTQTPSADGHMHLTSVGGHMHLAYVCRWPLATYTLPLSACGTCTDFVCRWPHTVNCLHLQGPKHTACGYIHRLCLQVATRTPPPSAGGDMHPTSIYRWPHAPCLHQQVATPTPPQSADGHMLLASACLWPQVQSNTVSICWWPLLPCLHLLVATCNTPVFRRPHVHRLCLREAKHLHL